MQHLTTERGAAEHQSCLETLGPLGLPESHAELQGCSFHAPSPTMEQAFWWYSCRQPPRSCDPSPTDLVRVLTAVMNTGTARGKKVYQFEIAASHEGKSGQELKAGTHRQELKQRT